MDIEYKIIKPSASLSNFVESFWMLRNNSEKEKDIVIVPDGRIDLFFSQHATVPFNSMLMGLESQPTQAQLPAKTVMYAVSFKLLAVEYLFNSSIADILNTGRELAKNYWGVTINDLNDFDRFVEKTSTKMISIINHHIDERKQKLFDLIYASNGSLSIKELSEKTFWSSRQINRYFNQWFGMSLKAYCNILRFRASFQHIKDGKLFPEQNFTDQAHFIKEIKKLSGTTPKELYKNKNDRFLQFSALKKP